MARKAKKKTKGTKPRIPILVDREFMRTLAGPHQSKILSATINAKGRIYIRHRVDLEDSLGSDQLLNALGTLV